MSSMTNETDNEDRRQYHRVGFHANALLSCSGTKIAVEILDISMAGALLKLESQPKNMDAVILEVKLSDEANFEMYGSLVPHDGNHVALHRDLSRLENDYHLRRLLELNLGDPTLMERDVETLIEQLSWPE
jgi:hypothetical protein